MSPLLFVLSMEYLSRLFKQASLSSGFAFHPFCKKMGLTHLMFADDLILFCKAHPPSLQKLMEAFHVFPLCSGLKANMDKSSIVFGGNCSQIQQECLDITGFSEGKLPFRYLGLPITASKLSKRECSLLVEKITGKMRTWVSRHISYAGRVVLINSVLFGMFNFWAKVFLLPQEVIQRVTNICRNFLWEGSDTYSRAPYIAWDTVCTSRKQGGLGVKNLLLWNQASIAKLVWDIARKKDCLWIQWIHGRYLKGKDWWDYSLKNYASWYWKKLLKVRDIFQNYPKVEYKVKEGYDWLCKSNANHAWTKIIWSRLSIPRHSIIAWMLMHQKLPVLGRLGKYNALPSMECRMCNQNLETQDHLFFACEFAQGLWRMMFSEWQVDIQVTGLKSFVKSILQQKMSRKTKGLFYAMANAVIYNIWYARNRMIYQNKNSHVNESFKEIKRQITYRVLHLHQSKPKHTHCIEWLLNR